MENKIQISNELLCSGLPNEFCHYLNYCKNLKFEDRPDYEFLKGLFGRLLGLVITNFNIRRNELIFDWCFKDVDDIWKKYTNKEEFEQMEKEKTEIEDKASENDEEDNNNKRGFIDSLLEEPSKENEDSEEDEDLEEGNGSKSKKSSKLNSKLSFNDVKNSFKKFFLG